MNRLELIEEKRAEIQEQLTAWANEALQLKPGEQLVFSLRLDAVPIVVGAVEGSSVLSMEVGEYFTEKRFLAAGLTGPVIPRARLCILNGYNSQATVADLVSQGEEKLLRQKNAGTKVLDFVKTVLLHDGIKLE